MIGHYWQQVPSLELQHHGSKLTTGDFTDPANLELRTDSLLWETRPDLPQGLTGEPADEGSKGVPEVRCVVSVVVGSDRADSRVLGVVLDVVELTGLMPRYSMTIFFSCLYVSSTSSATTKQVTVKGHLSAFFIYIFI